MKRKSLALVCLTLAIGQAVFAADAPLPSWNDNTSKKVIIE
jgi:hypothetical protein